MTTLQEKLTCKRCRMPFWYGWETLEDCAEFLEVGVTSRGINGRQSFRWIKCSGCGQRIKVVGMRLAE